MAFPLKLRKQIFLVILYSLSARIFRVYSWERGFDTLLLCIDNKSYTVLQSTVLSFCQDYQFVWWEDFWCFMAIVFGIGCDRLYLGTCRRILCRVLEIDIWTTRVRGEGSRGSPPPGHGPPVLLVRTYDCTYR
jgi:hypothetical protein